MAALSHVTSGMTLGLGTGSTAAFFIKLLGEKIRTGLEVKGVPTSKATADLARQAGIELIIPDETTPIHLAVDGADEADPTGHLIKGGGGALLREKIIAAAAERFIVIADASKQVTRLGAFALPIEIEPFGWALTVRAIRATLVAEGYPTPQLQLRSLPEEEGFFRSDGGNLVVDANLERIEDPATLDRALTLLPGVITTGLFVGLADQVIFGHADRVEVCMFAEDKNGGRHG